MKKKLEKCATEWCTKFRTYRKGYRDSRYCSSCRYKATIHVFLGTIYKYMKRRVEGKGGYDHYKHYWLGKPILPRDIFISWSKNHPDFLKLYKQWKTARYDRRLTPSINRMDSNKGYTLDNMEWMTASQNYALASSVRKTKRVKTIYQLLGVKY